MFLNYIKHIKKHRHIIQTAFHSFSDARPQIDFAKQEKFDSEIIIKQKVHNLLNLIENSNHFIAFTGAGISTAAGIPDYRSGYNTILKTGPGKWEEKNAENITREKWVEKQKLYRRLDTTAAQPTKVHYSLAEMVEKNVLKYIISQNIDGLHRRSGIKPENISELHGNTYLETCQNCKAGYMRDFRTRNGKNAFNNHITGRNCDSCGGQLLDSIVNFGESLPAEAVKQAKLHTQKADLCLAMGSSLQVKPAMLFPMSVGKRQNADLAIINLQPTILDNIAKIRIWGKVEDVMEVLMDEIKKKY